MEVDLTENSGGKKSTIGNETRITLGFVIIIILAASWMTTIYNQGIANAKSIEEDKTWRAQVNKNMFLIMGALHIKPDGSNE